MENIFFTIHSYLFMGIATLFLFQSIILFIHSRQHKARRTMAFIEMIWGIVYTLTLILISTIVPSNEFSILREKVLIVGSFFITLTNLFPIQVLLPGWLNVKRIFFLFLPNILQTGIYYGVLALLGETTEELLSYSMLWESIGHFNVWFRFVVLLSNIIYLVWILIWLYGYEKKYIQWKNDNFSDQEYVDISWMRTYDYIVIGISIFYMAILFIGGRLPVICHSIYVVTSFSYLFYKTLFYENPYPEDFFNMYRQPSEKDEIADTECQEESTNVEEDWQEDKTLLSKMPMYISMVKSWMENEKPYLYNDFKLTDMSRILPLNRTYISHIINEGYGQNFSDTVRKYRIEYSKNLLKNNPSIPMYKVAQMSGFHSTTTFIRTFKNIEGMTPIQFKRQLEMERINSSSLIKNKSSQ